MSKNPRQSKVRNIASIVHGDLYFEDVRQCCLESDVAAELLEDASLKAIRLISLSSAWIVREWVDMHSRVTSEVNFEMTLRKEKRGQANHWYAYRRVFGKLYKRYVGQSEQVTESRLLEIAKLMPG